MWFYDNQLKNNFYISYHAFQWVFLEFMLFPKEVLRKDLGMKDFLCGKADTFKK